MESAMKFLVFLIVLLTGPISAQEPETLRVQVLLDRAHFSVGEIDGVAGSNHAKALSAFQEAHGLPISGKADEATLQALEVDVPTLIMYTLTSQDVAGPFRSIPASLVEKSKLSSLPYSSVVESLAERLQTNQALLKKLNPNAQFVAGETLQVPNVAVNLPANSIMSIVVDTSAKSFRAFDASGKLLAFYPTTIGRTGTPPYGDWTVDSIAHRPWYHPRPSAPGPEGLKIPPGPNSPVGVVWIDLSAPHYGIHGTATPDRISKNESAGCIRLTNWDALEVAGAIAKEVKVTVQR